MAHSYGTSVTGHAIVHPLIERLRKSVATRFIPGDQSGDLHVSRLTCLMMLVLLLTFGAVYKMIDADGVNAFLPEVALAVSTLLALAASYRFEAVQRSLNVIVRVLCFLASAWFITLATVNGFTQNYAAGLLFIIPGIGVAYSLCVRRLLPLGTFFALNAGAVSVSYALVAGMAATPVLFIASLICICLLTLFVAGSRLHAQQRFHESEERYRAVIDQASDGIYMVDSETLRFLDANDAFCVMTGLTKDQLQRMSVAEVVVPTSTTLEDLSGNSLTGRNSSNIEKLIRRADGTVLFAELHIDRVTSSYGEILSVVVHDVSARKEYEQRLVKVKESAEEIVSFKSSLLANMSHEIRTPLSSILGWTSVLNAELPEQQRELVKLIEESGRRLHNTLDSVLELAQLQANAKKLQPVIVDVNDEVKSVVDSLSEAAGKKGLRVTSDFSGYNVWAETDISCLRRILNHVVENAIKFTEKGEIAVMVRHSAQDVSIVVQDTGVGISEEFLSLVFDEFKQESAGLSRRHEGNGLGLAITRRLVDMLSGSIQVQSRRGEGSTFTINIPMNAATRTHSRVA
ncbi:MAG: PAS domain-containing sensor histidine kinase [Rhodothermales bacterium]